MGVRVVTASWRIPVDERSYEDAIEGLARQGLRQIRSGKAPASLYGSGAVYRRERRDTFRTAREVAGSGWGDCEDLSAYRIADLRFSGEDPAAQPYVYKTGKNRYHAVVRRGDGSIEDPSRKLGMSRKSATVDPGYRMTKTNRSKNRKRAKAIAVFCARNHRRSNIEGTGACVGVGDDPAPRDTRITFDLYRSGQGYSGIVRLPIALPSGDGRQKAIVAQTSKSPTKASAAKKTVNLATKIAKLPGVQAVVPPQARLAAQVLASPTGRKVAGSIAKSIVRRF